MSAKTIIAFLFLGIVAFIGWETVFVVQEYQRAVVLQFGKIKEADLAPGVHLKLPFIDKLYRYDARLQTMDAASQRYLTLEQKALIVDSFTKWRIDNVAIFYTATSGDLVRARQLLAQRLENRLRNAIGGRTMHEVVSGQRDQLMEEITAQLNAVSRKEMGIQVVDVRLKTIDLPPQVSDSVFSRMRTAREKEAQEHRAQGQEQAEGIRADADRQKRVLVSGAMRDADKVKGLGDATAAQIYAAAYAKAPDFYAFYRSLQAYAKSIGGHKDILVLSPESRFFRYFNRAK